MTNIARRNQKQTVIDIFNRRADDRIEKQQTQKQLLAIIQQKNTQLSVLSHVNTRLGAQLVILQRKLGIDHDLILKQLQEINQISAAFHYETQQLEYLDALLTAYDQNNLKQKKIIAHLYSSLEDAEKKTQNLVKDNQFLLGEMQQKTKQILQIYSKGFVDDNLTSSYSKLQRETQLELMENIRTQNDYLFDKYRALEDKLEKKQEQFKQAKRKSDHYFELYKKQAEQLKLALIKIDDLIKIKDVLERKFDQITQENIELQTLREQLQTKVTRLQGNYKQLSNKFHLQKTLKMEEVERVGKDFQTLKCDHQASQKRERQYFNKNMLLQKDLQNQREDLKLLKRELEKTKSDFQQTLKMCEAYQTKINIFNKKQVIVRQTLEDHKQKLQNALLERDKALIKQKQLQKVIESLKQRNRDQIDALKNTFQKLIYEQNEKIKILQQDKDDTNSVFYQNECSLKHQIQKLKKDNQMLREQNFRHAESVKTNSGSQIVSKLKQLQEKNQSYSRMLNQKQRSYREDLQHKEQMIRNLQSDNRDMGRQVDRERASARQAINERTQLKSRISMLQKQKECLEQQVMKLKRTIDIKADAMNDEKQSKIRQLQLKLQQSVRKQKQTKQRTLALLHKYNEVQQQIKLQYETKIHNLENQINSLKHKLQKKEKKEKK